MSDFKMPTAYTDAGPTFTSDGTSPRHPFGLYPNPPLGPQLRRIEDVPSLHKVVLDHFTKPEQGDGR